ncbi:MAG: hypothetical protein PHQ43_08675 [Dehalococcoidales bacterium]|nr:hypothetical protein [Dehalococcoidales bacterium]
MVTSLITVAAAGRQVVKMAVSKPMSYDKRMQLEQQFGRWAMETAIGICPHNDVRCIEREAKRLHEARKLRR